MKRYVGEIEGLPRIADCAEEIGAHSVAGAENHCTLAAVPLVPPIHWHTGGSHNSSNCTIGWRFSISVMRRIIAPLLCTTCSHPCIC